tara:strand:+ start:341 stop:874 length:534 start_codon:yes stop_codon:yes gene_type:complete
MTSKLIVDSIEGRTGATVSLPQDSNYMLDQWRLSATISDNDTTLTGWERPDDSSFGRIGTGMTESSGIFTFPSTGVYLVTANVRIYIEGTDATAGYVVKVSTDGGSSSDTIASAYEGDTSANDSNTSASSSSLINVTNASLFQVFIKSDALSTNSTIRGDTSENQTMITFERKGPSQ